VHITQFKAHITRGAKNVHAQSGLVHEIHGVRPGRNIVIGEQDSSREFQVWRNAAVALEIPFQSKRIKTHSVRRVGRLERQEYGNGIDCVLKAATQEAWQMRVRENPSVSKTRIENTGIAAATTDRMAATRPNLDFATALFRRGLGRKHRGGQQDENSGQNAHQVDGLP